MDRHVDDGMRHGGLIPTREEKEIEAKDKEIARLRERYEIEVRELRSENIDLARELDEARALAERWRDNCHQDTGPCPAGWRLPWEREPSNPGQHVPHKRWLPEFE